MGPLHLHHPSHGSQNHFNLNEKKFSYGTSFQLSEVTECFSVICVEKSRTLWALLIPTHVLCLPLVWRKTLAS